MEPSLIVGRDRAHVRELLKTPRLAEVISASAFFDKVRSLAFIYDAELQRDDNAVLVVAKDVLARSCAYPLSYAKNFVTLYSSLYHGTKTPLEVYAAIKSENPSYLPVIEHLALMDEKLQQMHRVNGVGALYRAWRIIEERGVIPPALHDETIELCHLIDLTMLEAEVIKSLAQRGVPTHINLPIDPKRRAFNVPIDYAARPFEALTENSALSLSFEPIYQDGPLKEIVEHFLTEQETLKFNDEQCSITIAANLLEEAEQCAQRVAHLKTLSPTDSIAVVVRSMDERSKVFKHALTAYGILVKDRKGIPILETPAGIFLANLFSLCLSSLARSDVISALTHTCSAFRLLGHKRAQMIALLNELGCDDRIMRPFLGICRYQTQLKRAFEIFQDPEKQQMLQDLSALIEQMNTLCFTMPAQATIGHYLRACLSMIEQGFHRDKEPLSIIEALAQLRHSAELLEEQSVISFQDFKTIVFQELATLTEAYPDTDDVHATEFLMLPELLGRSFDHVLIADISFGRMPQTISADPILKDEHRVHLNKLLKKEVLRIYFDDPFEPLPVPPRQALEPFWFTGALAAAQKSIHFSYAEHDHQAREQAPSEFFVWLRDHIEISRSTSFMPFMSKQAIRFCEGKIAFAQGEAHDWLLAQKERTAMFQEQQSGKFAGYIEPPLIQKLFAGRLGDNPTKALTPTMVEAFSQCRFSGLFSRILNVDCGEKSQEELDHRALGAIAHKVLEIYYQKKSENLKEILYEVSESYKKNNFIAYPDIFYCQMGWLEHLLERLIHTLKKEFNGTPLALERAFGLGKKWPGVMIGNHKKYLLGGVIDRIDMLGAKVALIDYKLSSIAQLKANAKNQFTTNFQVPIYLRLVASWLDKNVDELSFYYASLRDGEILEVKGSPEHGGEEDILFHAINTILEPVEKGNMSALMSERCTTCDLHRICRRDESKI